MTSIFNNLAIYSAIVTSKVDHLALEDCGSVSFDSHGEALCSISDVSLLEIVTKTRGKPNGYRKIVKVLGSSRYLS